MSILPIFALINKIVSILSPVRNEAKYLNACLDSIRDQSYRDWELIVIDDHSEDKTAVILEEYAELDVRIKWYPNKGKGILPALQQAFELSSGDFVTRMDGDDLMPSYKLEKLHELLEHAPPRTIATGKVRYFGETEVSEGYRRYEQWMNEHCEKNDHWDWVYRECVIASPNWLCRRKDLIELGGFSNLSYPEDYDLVLKWYQNNYQVVSTNEMTHLWREHTERTSRNSPVYDQESFFQLKIPYMLQEFPTEQIIVLGVGQKARLCKDLLTRSERQFTALENKEAFSQPELLELPIENSILLIAVYPEDAERMRLLEILNTKGFVCGKNAFFV